MEKIIIIGLDIAKHVFQVHGVDGAGAIMSRSFDLADKQPRDAEARHVWSRRPEFMGARMLSLNHIK